MTSDEYLQFIVENKMLNWPSQLTSLNVPATKNYKAYGIGEFTITTFKEIKESFDDGLKEMKCKSGKTSETYINELVDGCDDILPIAVHYNNPPIWEALNDWLLEEKKKAFEAAVK